MENNHYGVESSIAGRNQFFMKVYAWMFGGLAISALVAYLFSTVPALYSAFFNFMVTTHGYGMWVIIIAQLVLVFVMRPNYEELGRPIRYIVSYCIYAALTGFTFFIVTQVYELGSIVQAFISTCALFVGLSIVGFTTKKDLTSFGRQAMGALLGLIIASLINLFFFHSSLVELIMSGISLVIFTVLTMYDTQKLKNMYNYYEGQSALEGIAILGALELYLDFINIFLDILRLFGSRKD